MLNSMTSKEITEWQAYFKLREKRDKENAPKQNKGKANNKATLG